MVVHSGKNYFVTPAIGKVFLAVVILNLLTVVILSVIQIVESTAQPEDALHEAVFVAVMIAIIGVFAIYFAFHSVLSESKPELLAFFVSLSLLEARVIFEAVTDYQKDMYRTLVIVKVVLVSIFSLLSVVLGIKVWRSFGWRIFKTIGGDIQERAMYRRYMRFFSVLKVDMLMCILLVVTGIMVGIWDTVWGMALNIIGVLLTVCWTILGSVAVDREIEWCMRVFFLFSLGEPVYIICKAVQLKVYNYSPQFGLTRYIYLPLPYLAVLGCAAIGVRCFLLYLAVRVYKDFGKGLKIKKGAPQNSLDEPLSPSHSNTMF